jgi:hypothetical protein
MKRKMHKMTDSIGLVQTRICIHFVCLHCALPLPLSPFFVLPFSSSFFSFFLFYKVSRAVRPEAEPEPPVLETKTLRPPLLVNTPPTLPVEQPAAPSSPLPPSATLPAPPGPEPESSVTVTDDGYADAASQGALSPEEGEEDVEWHDFA